MKRLINSIGNNYKIFNECKGFERGLHKIAKQVSKDVVGILTATDSLSTEVTNLSGLKDALISEIVSSRCLLEKKIEKTQNDLLDLKSRIVKTSVCKVLLTKVDQLIDRGQLKSKFKDQHNEFERRYENFVTEYDKDGSVQKSQV